MPPIRKPNRLPFYDYSSPGVYFVTICTRDRRCSLSDVVTPAVGDGSPVPPTLVVLKDPGRIVQNHILQIPKKYPTVSVDTYVIMPNHIHLLLSFGVDHGTGNPSPTLGNVIGWLKYQATKQINQHTGTTGCAFFQRSYHDHVIRCEGDYLRIWNYIDGSPACRHNDCFYTEEHDRGDSRAPLDKEDCL